MAAAPLIGEHNDIVFQDFLGLTGQEYADYQRQGAFA